MQTLSFRSICGAFLGGFLGILAFRDYGAPMLGAGVIAGLLVGFFHMAIFHLIVKVSVAPYYGAKWVARRVALWCWRCTKPYRWVLALRMLMVCLMFLTLGITASIILLPFVPSEHKGAAFAPSYFAALLSVAISGGWFIACYVAEMRLPKEELFVCLRAFRREGVWNFCKKDFNYWMGTLVSGLLRATLFASWLAVALSLLFLYGAATVAFVVFCCVWYAAREGVVRNALTTACILTLGVTIASAWVITNYLGSAAIGWGAALVVGALCSLTVWALQPKLLILYERIPEMREVEMWLSLQRFGAWRMRLMEKLLNFTERLDPGLPKWFA